MIRELKLENAKLLRKPRTYIGPVALLLILVIMLIGLKNSNGFNYLEKSMGNEFIIAGKIINAGFMARYLLDGIFFFILPLSVCTICGDLLASESADGTLRMVLSRPISRLSLITTKYIICVITCIGMTLGIGLIAYLLGAIFLGRGNLFTIPSIRTNGIWVLNEQTAIVRLIAAYTLTAMGMLAIGSISFMISTFLSSSNGAIFGAMGFLMISAILGEIEYFSALRPYLLTTYLGNWKDFFGRSLDIELFIKSIGVMLLYSAISFAIGAIIFKRRDVLV